MIIGLGNDIMDVARVRRQLESAAPAFREQTFSPLEIGYCEGKRYPARHYAARFAAKEAFFKALGTGLASGFTWRDVEVRVGAEGRPELALSGASLRAAQQRGVVNTFLSLTHTADLAMASVVLEGHSTPAANEVQP
ncbi:MAG TPA: holo-ACP synthase [Acidobacteriota bacterium]|nr:holo-ACP synthase [Acidobacteriota bacterium]